MRFEADNLAHPHFPFKQTGLLYEMVVIYFIKSSAVRCTICYSHTFHASPRPSCQVVRSAQLVTLMYAVATSWHVVGVGMASATVGDRRMDRVGWWVDYTGRSCQHWRLVSWISWRSIGITDAYRQSTDNPLWHFWCLMTISAQKSYIMP